MNLLKKTLLIGMCFVAGTIGRANALVKAPPQRAILPNGMKVLVVEDHSLPMVAGSLLFNVGLGMGGSFEPGYIPLAAILREKGDSRTMSRFDLNARLEELGCLGIQSGGSMKSFIGCLGSKTGLEGMLKYLQEIGFNLKPTQESLDAGKTTLIRQNKDRQSFPLMSGYLTGGARAMLFKGTPLAKSVYGTPESIAAISLPLMEKFLSENFVPNNAVLVIVGDVEAIPTFKMVNEMFGKLAARPLEGPMPEKWEVAADREKEHREFLDIKDTQVVISYQAPTLREADMPVAELWATALSEANNSWKRTIENRFPELRNLRVIYSQASDFGTFSIGFQTDEPDVDRIIANLLESLGNLWLSSPRGEALSRLVTIKKSVINQESEARIGQSIDLGYAELAKDFSLSSGLSAALEQVTSEDLERVAKKIFSSQDYAVNVVHPLACQVKKDSKTKELSLENGIKVVIKPYLGSELAAVSFRFPCNVLAETAGKEGMSSLVEFMFEESAANDDANSGGVAGQLDAIGGHLSVDANSDSLFISACAGKDRLPELMGILKQVVFTSDWKPDLLKKGITKTFAKLADLKNNPAWVLTNAFMKVAYAGTPFGRGDEVNESLRSISLEEVKAFRKKWVSPDMSACTIVGNVEPNKVAAELKKCFGAVPSTSSGAEPTKIPSFCADPLDATKESEIIMDCPKESAYLFVGYRLPPLPKLLMIPATKNDFEAGAVLLHLLTWSRNGIFQREIINKGLGYDVILMNLSSSAEQSQVMCGLRVPREKLAEAKTALKAILEKLPTIPVSAADVQTAGKILESYLTLQMEKTLQQAISLNSFLRLGMGTDYMDEFRRAYREMTPEQVQGAAQRYYRNYILITGKGD